MTFTLVSHLRERLSDLIRSREDQRKKDEMEKERLALEVSLACTYHTSCYCCIESFCLKAEEARTRGTPVTLESFKAWKVKFDKAMAVRRAREEDEKLKGMTPKEREEFKKIAFRLSGLKTFLDCRVCLTGLCLSQADSYSSVTRTWLLQTTISWKKVPSQ